MHAIAVREGISYTFLEPDDRRWRELDGLQERDGVDALDRRTTLVAAATDPGGHTSFFCASPQMHAEPMRLHEAHRTVPGVLVNLVAMIHAAISRTAKQGRYVYIVADTDATAKMCEASGMQRVEAPVYVMKVQP